MNNSPSEAFKLFLSAAPDHAHAWLEGVQRLGKASALDPKTAALAYLAVLAALRLRRAFRSTSPRHSRPEPHARKSSAPSWSACRLPATRCLAHSRRHWLTSISQSDLFPNHRP